MYSSEFVERYQELENRFRQKVEEDRRIWKSSRYIPNMPPKNKVDFLFIGMEPSLGWWAKTPEKAEEKIAQGFKNFLFSINDFILHYCVREYLCHPSEYYITDLSKGAMLTKDAQIQRKERYESWYSLFCQEFDIVSKNTTKAVAIGKKPYKFLKDMSFQGNLQRILHYSSQANRYRQNIAKNNPQKFEKFAHEVSAKSLFTKATEVLNDSRMSQELIIDTLKRLKSKSELTESQKHLIGKFFYPKNMKFHFS